jgi:hypothetical protein
MAIGFLDGVLFLAASGGLGDFVVGAPATGFQIPSAAGALNATEYHYYAFSSDQTQWEIGRGNYTTSGSTQARTTIVYSANANAKVNFANPPFVSLGTILAEDMASVFAPETEIGGRLTLTSGTPVLGANATAQGTVFYTPYIHDIASIYNGTNWASYPFTEQSVVLDTGNYLSGKNYDWFEFLNAGVATLGYGPAWTNDTTPSAAISMLNGVWVNTSTITLRVSSSTTFSVGANQARYVGTTRGTANGQTGMAFSSAAAGGGNGVLGVYNAYNKVRICAYETDSNQGTGWAYNSTTWRSADGNANNRIGYVDGLGDVMVSGRYSCNEQSALTTDSGLIGITRDYSSGTPTFAAMLGYGATGGTATNGRSAIVEGVFLPLRGFHTIGAQEVSANGGSVTFAGETVTPAVPAGTFQKLNIELWM